MSMPTRSWMPSRWLSREHARPAQDRSDPHVATDLAKIEKGQPLSPILLVRGDIVTGVPLQIADGYHRVCASYHTDENTPIPVVLATLNRGK